MIYFELISIQLFIGFCMGFYFSSKKYGITAREVKLSLLLLLMASSYFLIMRTPTTFKNITTALILALVFFFGLWAGDRTRTKVEAKIRRQIEKDCIHMALQEFAKQAHKSVLTKSSNQKHIYDIEMYRALSSLNDAIDRIGKLGHTDAVIQIEELRCICESVARLSKDIKDEKDERYDDYVKSLKQSIGLSWEVLTYIEGKLEEKLTNTWTTLGMALRVARTVHPK